MEYAVRNRFEELGDLKMMVDDIKKDGKKHIAGVEYSSNSFDKVLHWCEAWRRHILLGLCPECRAKFTSQKEKNSYETHVDGIPTVDNLQLLIEVKENVFNRNYDEMKEKELKLKSDITHLKEKNELLERKLAALGQNNEQTLVNIQKLRSENEQLQSKLSQTIIYRRDSLDIQEDIKVCSAEWKTTEENMTAEIADLTNQLAQGKLHKRQDDSFRKLEALTMELNSKDEELHRLSVELEEVKQQRKRDIDFKDQELRRLWLELDETNEQKKRDIAAKDEELCKVMMELADEKSTKRENERLRDQIKTLQSEMNSIDGKLRRLCMEPDEAKQQKKGEIVRGKQGESSGMGAPMKEMHTFDCDSVPDVDRYHERDDCLIVPGYVQDLDKH